MKFYTFQVTVAATHTDSEGEARGALEAAIAYAPEYLRRKIEVMADAPKEIDLVAAWTEVSGYDMPPEVDGKEEVQFRTEYMPGGDGSWYPAHEVWGGVINRRDVPGARVTHYRKRVPKPESNA
jgi:hypothetical protein